jgi:hypothetical protein
VEMEAILDQAKAPVGPDGLGDALHGDGGFDAAASRRAERMAWSGWDEVWSCMSEPLARSP